MLMKDDKKNSVSLIMGKLMGDKKEGEVNEAPSEAGAVQDDSVGMETAAQELLQAIDQKSVKGIVDAIKSMIEMAEVSEPEEQI
jgi:hypothetical protein